MKYIVFVPVEIQDNDVGKCFCRSYPDTCYESAKWKINEEIPDGNYYNMMLCEKHSRQAQWCV